MATHPLPAPASRAGKYVTFQIARHYFAVEARKVKQVTPARDVVPLEHAMPLLRGALTARGRRVPVLDIRDRLGLRDRSNHPRTCVLLIEIEGVTGLPAIGVVVDKMTDIVEFRERDFRDKVVQLRPHGRPYGRPKTLLHLEDILTPEELGSLKSIF